MLYNRSDGVCGYQVEKKYGRNDPRYRRVPFFLEGAIVATLTSFFSRGALLFRTTFRMTHHRRVCAG